MPRMNLTEEEASFIERVRLKNAQDLAFNLGLEEAKQMAVDFLHEKHLAEKNSQRSQELIAILNALKRTIKL